MQCRASNPLARRIEGWSPKPCLGRPARKTRRTKVMKMKGSEGENTKNVLKCIEAPLCFSSVDGLMHGTSWRNSIPGGAFTLMKFQKLM